ncbi:MAG: (2Fe-2S)-binding protein [Alphaproteobacteria bacterium]|nr:(2Fe-2S)-binding protein [Alphaproteobacteria bacterium]MCZ6590426.1 (2Fe-2S)-binding protein [Alphaproteobacteria bacterium]
MTDKKQIKLTVNGVAYQREVETRWTLADFLRIDLGLTGTHLGCEHGVCGACTILLNGHTARSCLLLAVQADGQSVATVEGLADDDADLHPLQQAFIDHHGLQCGFCTPGILMTLVEYMADTPEPDEAAIRDVLSGHLCRCTGYQGIVAAAMAAATELKRIAAHDG